MQQLPAVQPTRAKKSRGLSITLEAVSVRRGSRAVLREVSLQLEAGERWALIGGNGAGKTQLLKLLATDVWPTPATRAARIYRLDGCAIDLIEAKQHLAYLGAEMQDKYARYGWNLPVGELLATGLHRNDLLLRPATPTEQRRVRSMLKRCGLTPLRARKFLSLSYGQQRLALLARALIQDPQWLLLDEFYNGLDTAYRRRVDAILDRARGAGRSWIAAAHRKQDVPRGTDRLIELRDGRVVSAGSLKVDSLTRLQTLAPGGRKARTHLRPDRRPVSAGRLLLRLRKAWLYVEYRCVLRDIEWELHRGDHWAVIGKNGAGKSSFLKLLYGDLSPAFGGTIERIGYPRGSPMALWKRGVGYVSPGLQTDYAIDVTVLDLVASGRFSSIGMPERASASAQRHALRWLKFFALATFAKRRPRELSYGQMRRALIARAMAAEPRILLLDEPLTGLDPRQRTAMKRLFARLMRAGVTLIIAVHHAEDLPTGVTHCLHLKGRRAVASPYDNASQVLHIGRADGKI